jgi:hypothetical protein
VPPGRLDQGARRGRRRDSIGPGEVLALVEPGLAAHRGECLGEAVAVVEPSWVATSPKAAERPTGHIRLFQIHRRQLDARSLDVRIEVAKAVGTEARLDDDRNLDEVRHGHGPGGGRLDHFVERPALGLVEEDR